MMVEASCHVGDDGAGYLSQDLVWVGLLPALVGDRTNDDLLA